MVNFKARSRTTRGFIVGLQKDFAPCLKNPNKWRKFPNLTVALMYTSSSLHQTRLPPIQQSSGHQVPGLQVFKKEHLLKLKP